jgi:hypothetical protein
MIYRPLAKSLRLTKTTLRFGSWDKHELPIDFHGKPVIKIPSVSNKYIGILGLHSDIEKNEIIGKIKRPRGQPPIRSEAVPDSR